MRATAAGGAAGALACALAAVLAAAAARAEEPPRTLGEELWHHLRTGERLADDPGGVRSRLADAGLSLQLFFNHTAGIAARGGRGETGVPRQSGTGDFFALADLEELGVARATQVLLHVKGAYNRNVNPDVRALSDPVDDADFDQPLYVSELWLQRDLFDGRLSLRAGYLEQQTVFDRNAYANSEDRQFLTTYLDNNGLIPLKTGLGATVLARPTAWLEIAVGTGDADNDPRSAGFDTAFDGVDSLMAYFEIALRASWDGPRGPLRGTYRLGGLRDGSKRTDFDSGRSSRGHWGAYGSFDQQLYREEADGEQGLGVFFRFGYADPDVSRSAGFLSGGFEYRGPLPGRDRDALGLGTYHTLPSDDFRRAGNGGFDSETGVELYYRIELLPWLAVTPDLQWIRDPGGVTRARDALVLALRTRVTF